MVIGHKIIIQKSRPIIMMLSCLVIILISAHYLEHLLPHTPIESFCNIVCWTFLLMVLSVEICLKKAFIESQGMLFFSLYCIVTIATWINGQRFFPQIKEYQGELLLNLVSIFVCVFVRIKNTLRIKDLDVLLKVILWLGVIAMLYAMIVQNELIFNVLRNVNASKSSWNYTSFFTQRNRYAQFCFLCIEAATFLYSESKKKRYVVFIIFAFLNILITDSQTSLFCSIFFILVYIYMRSKNKVFLLISGIVVVLLLLIMMPHSFISSIFLRHITENGISSAELRAMMWMQGMKELAEKGSILFGFGDASNAIYLNTIYKLQSFHNVFVDALFEGGVFRLCFYIILLVKLWKKSNTYNDYRYGQWQKTVLLSYCLYGVFEAGSGFFNSNFFGLITSLLFVFVALNMETGAEYR